MTAVENKLMIILMRLALLDAVSAELASPSGTTRINSQREQDTKIACMPSSGTPRTRGERVNDGKTS